ncbi:(2Fe-2S)-binding protein [Paenibacillus sp. FSL H8-0537]|uniref:(2Fe-2S)-binding protein n=1 Tax=Paenibacillus sp. FSL H8-0537 TaxID=2921399 RepID=UPI0031015157
MNPKKQFQIKVNGENQVVPCPENRVLADWLREDLRLTGTHIGCDTVSCGACTVLLDGMPIKACSTLAWQCNHSEVVTVEGLCPEGQGLSSLQQTFQAHYALQCGFCTSGFLIMASHLLERNEKKTKEEIAQFVEGNYCRCTGYSPIIDAIHQALERK